MKIKKYGLVVISLVMGISVFSFSQYAVNKKVDKSISISLPVSSWEIILSSLQDKPFKEVNSIIGQIMQQAQKQLSDTSILKENKKAPN